jgi:hypothetical protein
LCWVRLFMSRRLTPPSPPSTHIRLIVQWGRINACTPAPASVLHSIVDSFPFAGDGDGDFLRRRLLWDASAAGGALEEHEHIAAPSLPWSQETSALQLSPWAGKRRSNRGEKGGYRVQRGGATRQLLAASEPHCVRMDGCADDTSTVLCMHGDREHTNVGCCVCNGRGGSGGGAIVTVSVGCLPRYLHVSCSFVCIFSCA